ncbi:MAG: hypothetical protein JWR89_5235 [Tardiphaga sp.]|jgi:hypothetical protein|uniref:hypothetical protein n=1 Tax=Tardiphaga sp. TaxID=1926292 RepID=UPI0026031740|nr:hypothetical protein [Tardiphaga sp.]MDB5505333.1 hypothetical protein [Tardiphaga sp.]
MNPPLSGSLARTIGSAFKGLFLPALLVRNVPQTGGDPADPLPPIPANFPCKAIVESYSDYFKANNLVNASDRKVLILATSVGVRPKPDDRVTISGITFTLQDVATDPAEAVWTCRGSM